MDPDCHDFDTVMPVSTDSFEERQVRAEVASCVRSHAALVSWLRSSEGVDPARPSRLPGWSVGHVLTHVARNADSHRAVLDGRPQYPSPEARDTDIQAGAGRTWAVLVDDVASSAAELDRRWEATTQWEGTAELLSGPRPRHLLPLLRQREVEVHRADLGLGYGFDDMPSDYVRRDLRLLEMLWRARKPMGLTPLPDVALRLPPATRLAWMMGRTEVDGLAPAGLF
jgi:maleylpyruvate isomerase